MDWQGLLFSFLVSVALWAVFEAVRGKGKRSGSSSDSVSATSVDSTVDLLEGGCLVDSITAFTGGSVEASIGGKRARIHLPPHTPSGAALRLWPRSERSTPAISPIVVTSRIVDDPRVYEDGGTLVIEHLISPDTALRGGSTEVELGSGRTVRLRIPAQSASGQRFRLAGIGPQSASGKRSEIVVRIYATHGAPPPEQTRWADPIHDRTYLNSALIQPLNKEFAAWYWSARPFVAPGPRAVSLPYQSWRSTTRPRCSQQLQFRTGVAVDFSYAMELDRHFGYRSAATLFHSSGVEEREALIRARSRSLAMHGFTITPTNIIKPDYNWIVWHSVPQLQRVAAAILEASFLPGPFPSDYEIVDCMACYVQCAIPYVKDYDDSRRTEFGDDKERGELRTPLATLFFGGNCHAQTVLLAALVRAVLPKIGMAVIHCLAPTPHSILGVAIPPKEGMRTCYVPRIGDLVLVETTSDWGLGRISSDTTFTDYGADPIP